MRAAGLRPGAGPAFAAERLYADHGADHVAVYVQVADSRAAADVLRARIDARVHAHRQAEAHGVDIVDHPVEILDAEARDVQDRAEALAGKIADGRNLERDGREVVAGEGGG